MKVKNIYYNDFINFGGHCSLTVAMPYCSFKCGKELCQNSSLAKAEIFDIPSEKIIQRFLQSEIMDAIVFQGLEPFDSWEEMLDFIVLLRKKSFAPVVIYTGYNREEISDDKITKLKELSNIIIKFGRYIPNQEAHYDSVLKVKLVSDNQYAIEVKDL